ncbi:MAG: putative sigma-54 modulation protein [Zhongshania aliphaticivorans]|jgi:putative sigma-54 modulation protein|tara:strand:- start:32342 stop:32644 length:303 start_codon:yes stop_codon:yes gene_type:complete
MKEQNMQITVSGHHVDVTPSLRDYVNTKLGKLQRHFDNITNTDVTLSVEKLIQKAEATVHVAGADLFATCESEDMYAAIDSLTDKLDRQLIKHKEKTLGR